jgi:uncharacterized protein YecT (DUF1311 family)
LELSLKGGTWPHRQPAWAKKKTADCNIRAAETSTAPLIKEATRLRCETEQTQGRVEELKGLL